MLQFTMATPELVPGLRQLARNSEAHWGFSDPFLDEFDHSYNITVDFLEQNPVYVAMETGGEPVAFWGIDIKAGELEFFYVSERTIGTGIGRQMWEHLIQWCREHEVSEFHFVTSPEVVGFYQRIGAVLDGTVLSSIDGREIPRLSYNLRD